MTIIKLNQIKPGMNNLTINVKVVEISSYKSVSTRFGDARTAIALVDDETGRLNLKLWREHVDLVRPNDVILIENGFSVLFNNTTEINVGSKGSITVMYKIS